MSPTNPKPHESSPDCWCKPKVVVNGSNRTITHREAKDDPRKTD